MPIKNTLKIFASKFSMVYSILLYLLVMLVIVASVSVFAVIPIYRFLEEEGIAEKLGEILTRFVLNGYSSELIELASGCFAQIKGA